MESVLPQWIDILHFLVIVVVISFLEKQFDVILCLNPLQCLLTTSVMAFLGWVVGAHNWFKICSALSSAIVIETITFTTKPAIKELNHAK